MAIFKYIINIYTHIALHKYCVLLYFNHIHFCAKLITIKNITAYFKTVFELWLIALKGKIARIFQLL